MHILGYNKANVEKTLFMVYSVFPLFSKFFNPTDNCMRKNDDARSTYYRTDRFYSEEGGWWAKTREGDELGPFDSKQEAKEALSAYIDMQNTE